MSVRIRKRGVVVEESGRWEGDWDRSIRLRLGLIGSVNEEWDVRDTSEPSSGVPISMYSGIRKIFTFYPNSLFCVLFFSYRCLLMARQRDWVFRVLT